MFVLAHLSDPHLAPIPRPRISELVGKRIVGFLNWHRQRRALHRSDVLAALLLDVKASAPDHIAVTGDLVNIGLEAEFPLARSWLDALGASLDVTAVPGNHEAYVQATAGHSLLHWGEYMRGDGANSAAKDVAFPFVRRRGNIALIGVSTALPTLPFMATGLVGAEQLKRLSRTLDDLEREGLFRVVLIHHPPVSSRPNRLRRLLDVDDFLRVLAEHGAELVLHGHDHVSSLAWLTGPRGRIPAFGVPSASSPTDRHQEAAAYNLYRIGGMAGAWQCEAISRGFQSGKDGIIELRRQTVSPAAVQTPAR
jgi:3',5'-cyclic AMP phosphodiesterase CpdA